MPNQINDIIKTTLEGLGYSGSLNDMMRKHYATQASADANRSLMDLTYAFLVTSGATPSSIGDMWRELLEGAGYTGSFSDMYEQFWTTGGGTFGGATAPTAFAVGDWTLTNPETGTTLSVNISSLPDNGGSTITNVEYRVDGGAWTSSGGTVSFTITSLTAGTEYDVELRAVNGIGNGATGDLKSATPTAIPAAFVLADWGLDDAALGGTLAVTINSLPSSNGDTIIDIEYELDNSGTWVSTGGTNNFNITGLTNSQSYNVQIRAVNTVGASADSDTKSATPTPLPDIATLDFSGGSVNLTQSVTVGTDFGVYPWTSGASGGWWMGAWMYYDGTLPSTREAFFTCSSTVDNTSYMGLFINTSAQAGSLMRHGSGDQETVAATALTTGWHLVTVRYLDSGIAGRVIREVYVDDQTMVSSDLSPGGGGDDISDWNTLALGSVERNSGRQYPFGSNACGFAWGTGDPATAHSDTYNSGVSRKQYDEYNFAGDANATLEGYWQSTYDTVEALDFTDSGHVTAMEDSVAALDTWTENGAVEWGNRQAPFFSEAGTGTLSGEEIPVGAINTLTVTATLAEGEWQAPITFDTSKIDLWATDFGYGSIGVSSTASVITSNVLDITLTLDRDIYQDEVIEFNFVEGWVTDNLSSATTTKEGFATNSSATAAPATGTKISHGRTSIELDSSKTIGHYLDGLPYIVVPSGTVGISSISPAESTQAGDVINGAEKNPERRSTANPSGAHGYDERQGKGTGAAGYNSARKIDPTALTWAANDSLIKACSNLNPNTELGGTALHGVYIQSYGGYSFVASAPASDEISPALVGYDGTSARPTRSINLATIKSSLPTYATTDPVFTDEVPATSDLESRICRFNPAIGQMDSVETARQMSVGNFTNADGYGLEIAEVFNAVADKLISDETADNKENLIIWCANHGVQWYEPVIESGLTMESDGGQAQGKLFAMVASLYWTGQSSSISTLGTDVVTNELGQPFLIDSAYITSGNNHTQPDSTTTYRLHAKEKTVSSVSSLNITVSAMGSNETNVGYTNLLLKRVSDGATAIIVDKSGDTFTIDAQPTPAFATSDVVYAVAPFTETIGNPEWAIRYEQTLATATPSDEAAYRNLQAWAGQMMGIKALGLMHSNFEGFEKYVEEVCDGSYPTVSYEYPTHLSRYTDTNGINRDFDNAMWQTHWPTIKTTSTII